MNFKTRKKLLEENVFADIIVLLGAFREYSKMHPTYDRENFINYYNEKNDNIVGRCLIQRNVIRQANIFYKENNEFLSITYSRVKRIFRRDINSSYKIRVEQYFFWKYVMDNILKKSELMDIMFREIIIKCKYYTLTEDNKVPYVSCMQELLDWYYVRMTMNKRIFTFDNKIREKMHTMFFTYEKFPEFKGNCRIYHSQL